MKAGEWEAGTKAGCRERGEGREGETAPLSASVSMPRSLVLSLPLPVFVLLSSDASFHCRLLARIRPPLFTLARSLAPPPPLPPSCARLVGGVVPERKLQWHRDETVDQQRRRQDLPG